MIKLCFSRFVRSVATSRATTSVGPGGQGTITRTTSLPLAEVLARFTAGPSTGVFTDGSCQPNPGPGGWGAVFVQDNEVVDQQYPAPGAPAVAQEISKAIAVGALLSAAHSCE